MIYMLHNDNTVIELANTISKLLDAGLSYLMMIGPENTKGMSAKRFYDLVNL